MRRWQRRSVHRSWSEKTIYDLRMFNDFIVRGGMNIAQPDVMRLGGISGWLEASTLAKANGLPVVPAAFNLMQIDVHLMASITNGLVMEHIPWLHSVFARPLTVREGHVLVPHGTQASEPTSAPPRCASSESTCDAGPM